MKGLYLIEREDGSVYIGKSIDIEQRISQHEKTKRFSKNKISRVSVFDIEKELVGKPVEEQITKIESLLINYKALDKPVLNKKKEHSYWKTLYGATDNGKREIVMSMYEMIRILEGIDNSLFRVKLSPDEYDIYLDFLLVRFPIEYSIMSAKTFSFRFVNNLKDWVKDGGQLTDEVAAGHIRCELPYDNHYKERWKLVNALEKLRDKFSLETTPFISLLDKNFESQKYTQAIDFLARV